MYLLPVKSFASEGLAAVQACAAVALRVSGCASFFVALWANEVLVLGEVGLHVLRIKHCYWKPATACFARQLAFLVLAILAQQLGGSSFEVVVELVAIEGFVSQEFCTRWVCALVTVGVAKCATIFLAVLAD